MDNQITIKKIIEIEGLGLHSGAISKMFLHPAPVNTGIVFFRKDLKNSEPIEASWKNIIPANLCTKISNKKNQHVSTIEHFMFALYSLGITNLLVELYGPEVPILDGSSKIFIEEIIKCGLVLQNKKRDNIIIHKSIEINQSGKFIKYQPTDKEFLEIDYTIIYNDQLIRKQNFILKNVKKNYKDVYSCRTFCHQEDLERIFAMGLAKGGSLDNAIVIAGNKVLNQEGLRFKNEFVRHKILDCIGDLYLSGYFINGKITCMQGGHELTGNLLKKIFLNNKNYSVNSLQENLYGKTKRKSSDISGIQTVFEVLKLV